MPGKEDPIEALRRLGINLEPDTGPGPYHREAALSVPMPNTKAGQVHILTCGHQIQTFGNVAHANGKFFCAQCRDIAQSSPIS